jgi:uncharacterized protein (TIGR00251 family)
MPELRAAAAGVTLRVRVQPRAGREGLAGVRAGALVVRLAAPPVEGRANEALVRYLAGALELPASRVQLQQGARGRDKLLLLAGASLDAVRMRLATLLEDAP